MAFLDEQTGHSYTELMEMAYDDFLILNLDVQAHLQSKQDAIDEATDTLYFNEINTIPGSFSFYLWEPSGVPFDELVDRLVTIARRRHREQNGRVQTYDVNLLSEKSLKGLKSGKNGE